MDSSASPRVDNVVDLDLIVRSFYRKTWKIVVNRRYLNCCPQHYVDMAAHRWFEKYSSLQAGVASAFLE
jgi:hypothetical protein